MPGCVCAVRVYCSGMMVIGRWVVVLELAFLACACGGRTSLVSSAVVCDAGANPLVGSWFLPQGLANGEAPLAACNQTLTFDCNGSFLTTEWCQGPCSAVATLAGVWSSSVAYVTIDEQTCSVGPTGNSQCDTMCNISLPYSGTWPYFLSDDNNTLTFDCNAPNNDGILDSYVRSM